MTIVETKHYEPSWEFILTEGGMVDLLIDVRRDILLESSTLSQTLDMIQAGKRECKNRGGLLRIDLSRAKLIIQEYEELTKRACGTCPSRRNHPIMPGETQFYCSEYETPSDEPGNSARITKYTPGNCPNHPSRLRPMKDVVNELD